MRAIEGAAVGDVGAGDGATVGVDGTGLGAAVGVVGDELGARDGAAVGTKIVPPRMRIVPVQLPLEKQPSCNVYA